MQLPRFYEVTVDFPRRDPVPDLVSTLTTLLESLPLTGRLQPSQSVAVTAGSRGIADVVPVLATVVAFLKTRGAEPFLFPAMGSHGGATSEGQTAVLARLGITAESVGAPVRSSMETVHLATTPEGVPVYQDRLAHRTDWVVVVNRVKRHTGFAGATGSGMLKMLAVGAGKHLGAQTVHRHGVTLGYENAIVAAGRAALSRTRVLCGVGLIEDAYGKTAEVRACLPESLETTDRELLAASLPLTPKLPVDDLDLLVVDRMGKNISGTGMDTHVIGRIRTAGSPEPATPRIRRVFVRDLTPETGGNAIGVGLADFATDRLVDQIDLGATYTNCLTSQTPEKARIPVHYPSDRQCIERALETAGAVPTDELRIIRILDTLHLSRLVASEAVVHLIESRPEVKVLGEVPWQYDGDGNLL